MSPVRTIYVPPSISCQSSYRRQWRTLCGLLLLSPFSPAFASGTFEMSTESMLAPNQQGLEIRSTPRAEMNLYQLDTFAYDFPGREIKINFEIPEFTAICPFSD